jgi:hypothetical protein
MRVTDEYPAIPTGLPGAKGEKFSPGFPGIGSANGIPSASKRAANPEMSPPLGTTRIRPIHKSSDSRWWTHYFPSHEKFVFNRVH